ncbi:MAG: DNA topoisomerase IV subunit A [Chlamydiae bacterium]|nr:DNA topoisomerase IV subunit A [Chlamydiota bacterium]
MDDLKLQMKDHFIQYASYVILDRAIPNIVDGLKPVQRRILEILWRRHDDKLHKVANIVGQTMQLHPHGDAPIYEALVNLANKGYVLDRQGNFGNIYTGDPSAASRYIETRLSPLAQETLFNPDITEKIPSYDGRNEEPVVLPAKIPLLLLQGSDGIAVGMATHIMPHNFQEVLEAEIAFLEGKSFKIFPDFPTGGIMDKSLYDKGRGKVKLRARIEIKDPKTLVIKEICYGTTTESLIRSIDEAAKKGRIKIEAIDDYTSREVEIEIKLPRGQYAEDLLDALYGFTECEVMINSQVIVIKDNQPWETDVDTILSYHATQLMQYHKKELEIERDRLKDKVFYKSLERIFIEKRLYKKIENIKTLEGIHNSLEASLKPFVRKLLRIPTQEDQEKLLQIPIRRISQFDIDQNKEEIQVLEEVLKTVEKNLKNVKKFTIDYIRKLIAKYGPSFPRKTKIKAIEEIDRRAIETREIKCSFDPETGFVGKKVSGPISFVCTNFDRLVVLFQDGTYKVINMPDKQYLENIVWVGIANKTAVFNLIYKKKETGQAWSKRFVVDKFIIDKNYRYFEAGGELQHISTNPNASVEIVFAGHGKHKTSKILYHLADAPIMGAATKGVRISPQKIKKILTKES